MAVGFELGREGLVYVVGEKADTRGQGPFKIGHTLRDVKKRISSGSAFRKPGNPLEIKGQQRFLDRVWAEGQVHAMLAPYRMNATPVEAQEFFDCSMALVQDAIEKTLRKEAVFRKKMLDGLSFVGETLAEQKIPTSLENPLFNTLLRHPIKERNTVLDFVKEVLAMPKSAVQAHKLLVRKGIRCLPTKNIAVLRTKSAALNDIFSEIGYNDWANPLGKIAGFTDDGHPLSLQEIKSRCPGYAVERLLD